MIATREWVKSLLSKLNIGKYSTDEVRVGTWIDGKPLYRKVFYDINIGNSTTWHKVSSLDSLYIKDVTKCQGLLMGKDGPTFSFPIYSSSSYYANIRISSDNKEIMVQNIGFSGDSYPATIILEYTKTTD